MSGETTKDRCSECREWITREDIGWVGHGFLCSRIGLAPDASLAGLEHAARKFAEPSRESGGTQ